MRFYLIRGLNGQYFTNCRNFEFLFQLNRYIAISIVANLAAKYVWFFCLCFLVQSQNVDIMTFAWSECFLFIFKINKSFRMMPWISETISKCGDDATCSPEKCIWFLPSQQKIINTLTVGNWFVGLYWLVSC